MSFGLLSLAFGAALLWKKGTVITHFGVSQFTRGGKLAADSLNRLPKGFGSSGAGAELRTPYFDEDVVPPAAPRGRRATPASSGVHAATNALNAFVKKHTGAEAGPSSSGNRVNLLIDL
tara:strand:+ start:31000 stop:31356 length:357 start_codon:yes stop_codon:yes gene_type:complete